MNPQPFMSGADAKALTAYIMSFLRNRNGGELSEAFDAMTVGDDRLIREELELILECGGKPPNWVK